MAGFSFWENEDLSLLTSNWRITKGYQVSL